ncbi:MAG: DNA-deoxyinosine glycosylase [Clostridiales bacterium]|nr:DNA-deoxyinosine glycosylase [Clostridiales bacterium]
MKSNKSGKPLLNTMGAKHLTHTVDAVFDKNSKILILGTFPSVKSREAGFFYAHPQNRFWRVLACVFGCDFPETVSARKALLLNNRVALWDVIRSCEITGSADSSIKNVIPNDLGVILNACDIRAVFVNGKKAESLYKKYLESSTGIKAVCLPSTSPANAAWGFDALVERWGAEIMCVQ